MNIKQFLESDEKVPLPLPTKVITQGMDDCRRSGNIFSAMFMRDQWIRRYGFGVVTQELVNDLVNLLDGKKVIDVGCGLGYLTQILSDRGINIRGVTDKSALYFTDGEDTPANYFDIVEDVNYLSIDYSEYDAVIVSWEDYLNEEITEVYKQLTPDQLLIRCAGDSCIGSDTSNTYVSNNFETIRGLDGSITWSGLYDYWSLLKRKNICEGLNI